MASPDPAEKLAKEGESPLLKPLMPEDLAEATALRPSTNAKLAAKTWSRRRFVLCDKLV